MWRLGYTQRQGCGGWGIQRGRDVKAESQKCGDWGTQSQKCGDWGTQRQKCGDWGTQSQKCGDWGTQRQKCGDWGMQRQKCGGWDKYSEMGTEAEEYMESDVGAAVCGGKDAEDVVYNAKQKQKKLSMLSDRDDQIAWNRVIG
ncbi:PREDICTED: uncharacterized protein LOC106821339 [Priapulus caudatus]|uniref:Uncharacterized protein LOC106821339 n=1 Tax=Priapulus caudatus TaxID=37621 RepID=A0ABM1FAW4_PRICU|nr:PREDICTED: uncharacterized protein LOC106821339 [Priapulus caudatus]